MKLKTFVTKLVYGGNSLQINIPAYIRRYAELEKGRVVRVTIEVEDLNKNQEGNIDSSVTQSKAESELIGSLTRNHSVYSDYRQKWPRFAV